MNINDMAKNLDKNKLNRMLNQLSGTLSEAELKKISSAVSNLNSAEVRSQLSRISAEDISRAVKSSPELNQMLNANPELAKSVKQSKGRR